MNDFAGTASLVRLALRRDRVMLPVWLAVFVFIAAGLGRRHPRPVLLAAGPDRRVQLV